MGNRAVIKFGGTSQGIYLHWYGSKEAVQAFLDCAKRYQLRGNDSPYGRARLCQIIGNFLGGTLSLGVDDIQFLDCDNHDNGMFVIDDDFQITKREYITDDRPFNEEYYKEVFEGCCKKNDAIFNYMERVQS
jgi:hypothetical protein